MNRWIILPYDRSPVARAALRRTSQMVRNALAGARYAGVMLATAGIDPMAFGALAGEAEEIAGSDVSVEVRLLDAGDPIGALQRLVASQPDAVFAAPLDLHGVPGRAPWYAEARRLGGIDHTLVLFFVTPKEVTREIKSFEEKSDGRRRVGSPVARLLHSGTRLYLGMRAIVSQSSKLLTPSSTAPIPTWNKELETRNSRRER